MSLGKNSVAAVFSADLGQAGRCSGSCAACTTCAGGGVWGLSHSSLNSGRVKRGRRAFNRVIEETPVRAKIEGGFFSSDARSIFFHADICGGVKEERERMCERVGAVK